MHTTNKTYVYMNMYVQIYTHKFFCESLLFVYQ